ncbi:hypothetical protein HWV23_09590 [Natronomonas halophila]|uniref:hypothetical protein n=1 Tax=Natronomonas halophila TaxID=2747817 RepID=UPI0015B51C6D|nr:hypothetical protein [Natronomonas halophila]QLD85965.1 hypothetical protein HWV23_09590 [Natronomonas halophila]
MGLQGTLLWPVTKLAGWVDNNPLSAVGVVVALGALVALLVSADIVLGGQRTISSTSAATAISETVLAQPAYAVIALAGMAVFLFYDG